MDSSPEFTLAQIVEMENIVKELGERSLLRGFCKELASKFSRSPHGSLKPAITMKQVQHWFRDRLEQVETNLDSSPQDQNICIESMDLSGADILSSALETFKIENSAPDNVNCKKVKPNDLLELRFEALSSRDDAWYDIATFLTYRISYHGELEVRVRFSGFSKEEDEWVNVKRGVRERSIPLEDSECQRISVGDLVLCFRERMSHAIYCDAHIVGVHRRSHDAKSCLCIFMVRYLNDSTEEQVLLDRLCIRPRPT